MTRENNDQQNCLAKGPMRAILKIVYITKVGAIQSEGTISHQRVEQRSA